MPHLVPKTRAQRARRQQNHPSHYCSSLYDEKSVKEWVYYQNLRLVAQRRLIIFWKFYLQRRLRRREQAEMDAGGKMKTLKNQIDGIEEKAVAVHVHQKAFA